MQPFSYVFASLIFLIVLSSACPHDDERTSSVQSVVSETWAKIQNDKNQDQQEQPYLESVIDYLVDPKRERVIEHKCVHDKLMSTVDYSPARFSRERLEAMKAKQPQIFIGRQSTGPANIRFFADSSFLATDPDWSCSSVGQTITSFEDEDQTITCTQEDILTGSLAATIYTAILPPVLSILEQLLQVKRPVQGNFTVTSDQLLYDPIGQTCYPGVPIPDNLFAANGNGVPDTDYYMFITARPVLDPTFTVAFASPCAVELITQTNGNAAVGRPVVGIANFNPRQFQKIPSSPTALNSLIRVGVHEFTHALGFSPVMYDYYLDSQDPSNPNEVGDYYSNGPTITTSSGGDAFITPRVVSFARQHFDCDSLTEVPLETCCGSGTTGAHWLGTIAGDEYMTGVKSETMPITQLTLSLFEDMGWYRVNYVFADSMQWGYQKGCDFANGICDSTSWSGMGYLCDAAQGTLTGPALSCTYDRMGAGQCAVAPDPANSIYGDCPLTVGTKWCGNTAQSANVPIGEFFSPQSRCFQTQQVAKDYICYQVNCTENGTVLRLQLGDTWYTCPRGGGTIQGGIKVTGVRVECPDASEICQWSGINASEIKKYRAQGGKNFTWLFTNSTILFWAIVAIILLVLLGIIWCILRCCCDICCGMAKQQPANTMTGRMQIAARNRRQYLTQRMGRGRGRGAGGARVVPEMQLAPDQTGSSQALQT